MEEFLDVEWISKMSDGDGSKGNYYENSLVTPFFSIMHS